MGRKRKRYAIIEDAFGDLWDIFSSDPGDGIEWPRGWPSRWTKQRAGGPAIIITPGVKDWMETHARGAVSKATLAKLPISKFCMQRLRHDLGITRSNAAWAWWESRVQDILDMSDVDFAARHAVSDDSVAIWRRKLGLPCLQYPDAWYMSPEARAALTADQPLVAIARQFNRSVKTIWQVRYLLRKSGIAVADRRL